MSTSLNFTVGKCDSLKVVDETSGFMAHNSVNGNPNIPKVVDKSSVSISLNSSGGKRDALMLVDESSMSTSLASTGKKRDSPIMVSESSELSSNGLAGNNRDAPIIMDEVSNTSLDEYPGVRLDVQMVDENRNGSSKVAIKEGSSRFEPLNKRSALLLIGVHKNSGLNATANNNSRAAAEAGNKCSSTSSKANDSSSNRALLRTGASLNNIIETIVAPSVGVEKSNEDAGKEQESSMGDTSAPVQDELEAIEFTAQG